MAAAHAVIVYAAYFEVLATVALPVAPKSILPAYLSDSPFPPAGRRGDPNRLRRLASSLLTTELPMPSPWLAYEDALQLSIDFYAALSNRVAELVHSSDQWQHLDDCRRASSDEEILARVPVQAGRRYEELFRQLAIDCPEVALWINLVDHQATRHQLRAVSTGLAEIETMLVELTRHEPALGPHALARHYRDVLDRPILAAADVPSGLSIPSLAAAYVNPRFRVALVRESDTISDENWWTATAVRDDLPGFLLGHFTSPRATRAPLLVLGQPGSGKSLLTQVLAARLSSPAYLVVRVVLRDARAEADLQTQIESAARGATGEGLSWPELARTAENALPVVLLDGFDELLQATGASQSDYLEKVALFQEREAAQGRPVAVLVTSRTAVADRARPVEGTVAVRLEPFQDQEVALWLDVWNSANHDYFVDRQLLPLSIESLVAHRELVGQPLLLLMLALYDAEENALRHESATIGQTELYERLLTRFARREVLKTGTELDPAAFAEAVDQELLRLAVVAFSMFNRSRQWVTETEINQDLTALLGAPVGPAGLRAALTPAQITLGRFFFVHEAKAVQDDNQLRTYEFLHATFGEYLVARLVGRELFDLVDALALSNARRRRHSIDDSFLYALLSYAPLTMRASTVSFLADQLREASSVERTLLQDVLLGLCGQALMPRRSTLFADYEPHPVLVPGRHAAYSVNLVVLYVLAAAELDLVKLFPDGADTVAEWQRLTMLWRSQLPVEGWKELLRMFTVDRGQTGDVRTVTLRRRRATEMGKLHRAAWEPDLLWSCDISFDRVDPAIDNWLTWVQGAYTYVRKQGRFQGILDDEILIYTLDALSPDLEDGVFTFHIRGSAGKPVSAAGALITLWRKLSEPDRHDDLSDAFDTCLHVAVHGISPLHVVMRHRYRSIVLALLTAHRHRLPADWLADALPRIRQIANEESGQDDQGLVKMAEALLDSAQSGSSSGTPLGEQGNGEFGSIENDQESGWVRDAGGVE
ncbi:ATPase [Kutzneria sp. 744]|nr:ATPase [Kutzneria sp. 744]